MKNRILSFVLVLVMVIAAIPFGVAADTVVAVQPKDSAPDMSLTHHEYIDSSKVYTDVKAGSWYESAVEYVSTYGIMGGAGKADTFKPSDLSTRAMIAVILHRIESEPEAKAAAPFTDLKANWYKKAVNWAYETGIVEGSSATTFNPDGNVTRQELVTMLHRYVEYKELDMTGIGSLDEFPDESLVANWAYDALSWAVCAGFVRGRSSGDKVTLAPRGNSQRNEMATIFLRFCEKYDLVEESGASMEEVLADIKSDRVKKVIFDADSGNEMDDQYALAYGIASEKMDILSVNATLFLNTALVDTFEEGMIEGYNENKRILEAIGYGHIPQYYGCPDPLTSMPGYAPIASDASDSIIKTAHESDELIYVVATGALTNVASAVLKDPTIIDKICVVWMGGGGRGTGDGGGFNCGQDYKAAQVVLNCGVPFVMLPGRGPRGGGTDDLLGDRALLEAGFPGDDEVSRLFRETLARECDGAYDTDPEGWWHIFWDLAAVALFECNDDMDLEIITAPRIRNDMSMAEDEAGRHQIICMHSLNPDKIFEQAIKYINRLIDAVNFEPLTLDEIMADIKSDRVKKVIFDADAGNEIDDQYALAYALGSDKIEVLSASASQFLNTALVPTREEGMLEGYREINRVLKLLGREDVPVYKGAGNTTTIDDHYGQQFPQPTPIDCEAVDNIINTAKGSAEIIYVIVTGCATNISSAIAKDPTIKDKICVVWMGSNFVDNGGAGEFNLGQDNTAGRYLLNSGVNLIWLPAMSSDPTKGTGVLKTGRKFLEEGFPGTDDASSYFREELPLEHDGGYNSDPEGWWHIYWDIAAVTVFDRPDLCEFEVVDVPRLRADDTFSVEENRPKAIQLQRVKPTDALARMADVINTVIGK